MLISDEIKYSYQCPHCHGKIVLTIQYYEEGGFNKTIEHIIDNHVLNLEEIDGNNVLMICENTNGNI